MAETRRIYSREFKEDAVRLLETSEKTAREIEDDLGIGRGVIYRWRRQLREEHEAGIRAFPGRGNPRDEELARLRKENAEIREERDILRESRLKPCLSPPSFSKTKR